MVPTVEENPRLGKMGLRDYEWDWAELNFGEADLGDARRTARLVLLAESAALYSSSTSPIQHLSDAQAKGAYRLFNNADVTHAGVIQTHVEGVIDHSSRSTSAVLFIHDDTILDFSHRKSLEGLGPVGNGLGNGLMVHTCLAVDTGTNELVGMAHQAVWARDEAEPLSQPEGWDDMDKEAQKKWRDKERRRQRKEHKDAHGGRTEAHVWQETVEDIGSCPEGQTWVSVGDRGSDVYSHLAMCVSMGWECLVRIKNNRSTEEGEGIITMMRGLAPKGTHTVVIDRPFGSEETAEDEPSSGTYVLNVSFREVVINRPRSDPKGGLEKIRCHAVRAWNEPKKGGKKIEWILLSTLPVTCLEQAVERINWYKRRWVVEDFHKALKSGCKIECSQIRSVDALMPLIGLCSIVASRLVQRRDDARVNPDAPTKENSTTVRILAAVTRQPVAKVSTNRGFWRAVAKLGGFLGRKCDKEPGWITMSRGWFKLQILLEGASVAQELNL